MPAVADFDPFHVYGSGLKMVTIYDIAKRTGFSPPTVSKALNGTGGLSNATRTLILDYGTRNGVYAEYDGAYPEHESFSPDRHHL